MVEIDEWICGYKVRSFPWVDGENIYFNVQYYASGQSIRQPPVWDKTVYITDDEAGRRIVNEFIGTLVEYVARMQIPEGADKVVLTAQR